MQQLNQHLAHTLKWLRTERQWSLSQAAQHTGVSKAMLGQIERGESSPTVATLWKIATGFNVAFSVFLALPETPAPALPQRNSTCAMFSQDQADMCVTPLFPYDARLGFDLFVIDFAPGALSESSPHEAGVIEHVIVLEGELELVVNGHGYHLNASEALRFQADVPHGYHNRTSQRVRIHDLIHYPVPGAVS